MKTHLIGIAILLGIFRLAAPGVAQAPEDDVVRVDQIDWVDPPAALPAGVQHHTFRSALMDREVGYSIYLPTGYEESATSYPVVYWLHGRGGSEGDARPAEALHQAIESGPVKPMVLVLGNGGVASGYIDNPETGVMGESVVIRELIPHIEETYRVSSDRDGRGLAGFSMGGGGSIRLAIRNPRMFNSIVSVAGVLVGYQEIMERNFVVDVDLALSHDPFPTSIDVAPRLRTMNLKLLVGTEDAWVAENRRFAAHLGHQNLTVDYGELRGIDHNLGDYLTEAGVEIFGFFSTHLDVND